MRPSRNQLDLMGLGRLLSEAGDQWERVPGGRHRFDFKPLRDALYTFLLYEFVEPEKPEDLLRELAVRNFGTVYPDCVAVPTSIMKRVSACLKGEPRPE